VQDRIFFVHPGETMPRLEAQIAFQIKHEMLDAVEKK
jgi:hypothetical protein